MKEAKKTQITEQMCKQIQLMRKGGANQTEIGRLLGINGCTVSRIEAAGFDFNQYTENRKIRREKEAAKKQEEKPVDDHEIVGQMEMDLTTEKPVDDHEIVGQMEMDLTTEKPEMSEQTKMMRFQAAQVDKIIMKLDQIYNMVSMIHRAVRGE